jgi:hypothetical protein
MHQLSPLSHHVNIRKFAAVLARRSAAAANSVTAEISWPYVLNIMLSPLTRRKGTTIRFDRAPPGVPALAVLRKQRVKAFPSPLFTSRHLMSTLCSGPAGALRSHLHMQFNQAGAGALALMLLHMLRMISDTRKEKDQKY